MISILSLIVSFFGIFCHVNSVCLGRNTNTLGFPDTYSCDWSSGMPQSTNFRLAKSQTKITYIITLKSISQSSQQQTTAGQGTPQMQNVLYTCHQMWQKPYFLTVSNVLSLARICCTTCPPPSLFIPINVSKFQSFVRSKWDRANQGQFAAAWTTQQHILVRTRNKDLISSAPEQNIVFQFETHVLLGWAPWRPVRKTRNTKNMFEKIPHMVLSENVGFILVSTWTSNLHELA